MLEIRDSVAIGSVGDYLRKSKDELRTVKIKLDKDIQEICNYYIGKDANIIATKFLDASNKLNPYIETIGYYGDYINYISNHDKENIKTSRGSLQTVIDDQLQNNSNLYKKIVDDEVENGEREYWNL